MLCYPVHHWYVYYAEYKFHQNIYDIFLQTCDFLYSFLRLHVYCIQTAESGKNKEHVILFQRAHYSKSYFSVVYWNKSERGTKILQDRSFECPAKFICKNNACNVLCPHT